MADHTDTTVRGHDESDDGASLPNLRLEVVRSPDPCALRAVLSLGRETAALLGRDIADGLVIRDPRLSRLHLKVTWEEARGGFVYHDAESANGTFVNGHRADSGLLLPGDVVRVGDTLLVAVDRDPSAELGALVDRCARSPLPLLLRGESGSGKELLARAVHEASGRSGPFVAVNCAALPSDLAATELFGHTRGAFSGAGSARPGLFRSAEAGTLLLDEIGDLPLGLQGHLLRVLQEGTLRPVGSDREVGVDVRIIAATHVGLEAAVSSGRFRADLLARLAQLVLVVPPLRERRAEILTLAAEFAPMLSLTANAAEALLIWDWPGNVRELKGLLASRATLAAPDAPARARDLADRLPTAERVLARDPAPDRTNATAVDQRKRLAELIAKHDGNITRVAEELGKPRAQIYRWLRAFGLARDPR
jgi:transcriptional regulator with GAF, ATPase, and Fis domain